ncbi:MAG: T9SS type A sorting domain-containing protein, partial [Bacteroidia bacterium]
ANFSSGIDYGASSTLRYAVGGTKTVANEWFINSVIAGSGTPNNVIVDNTSTINLPFLDIGMAGDLTIEGTVNMNVTSGDLQIGKNWLRRIGGVFNPNNRAVIFGGTSPSTITLEGGGTEFFNYLIVDKSANTVFFSNSPATDITVNASIGNVLELRNASTVNLNGRTLALTGTGGNIRTVSGVSQIIGSSASVLSISNGTKTVTSFGGSLSFGPNVTVALNSGINFGSNLSTINGTLQIALGGFVTGNAPIYGTNSILRYFTGSNYGRGLEWSAISGAGYPFNVQIDFNGTPTTLDLSNGGSALRRIAGNLVLNDGGNLTMGNMTDGLEVLGNVSIGGTSSGSLTLSSTFGGDLFVGGNLSRNTGGVLTQNSREVSMFGTLNQTITGLPTIDFLRIANTGTSPNNRVILTSNTQVNNRLFLENGQFDLNGFAVTMVNQSQIRRSSTNATMSSVPTIGVGDQIDMRYDATLTTGIEYPASNLVVRDLEISAGTLTLGGNRTLNRDIKFSGDLNLSNFTLTLRGRSNTPGVNGNIEITSGNRTVTGSAGSVFEIVGLNGNSPIEFSKTVTNPGSGTLNFSSDVLVSIGDGRMDWGTGSPVTVNGVLQVKLGGSVFPNPCYFGINSTLRFSNTVDYGVPATDYTWAPGAINSGLPGIPWNVEVNDVGTELQLLDTRSLRGSLFITNGTFSLMPSYTGSFNLGGDWIRTGALSAFNHNNKKVVFNRQSTGNQNIQVSSGVTSEIFYDLEISPISGNLILGTSTDVEVDNTLSFVSGKIDLNSSSNTLIIGTASVNGSFSGASATSYVISNGANIRQYSNSNGTYTFPVGDASNFTPIDVTLISGGQTASYLNGRVVAASHPNIVTATNYINRYWVIEPIGLAASPSYNVAYTYASGDLTGPAASLYPSKWSSLGWIASPGSSANAIDGTSANHNIAGRTFGWDGLTTFSEFTAAGDGSPLPVELLGFNANVSTAGAVLTDWITASEINCSHYIVEKSINALDYEYVGRVVGSGNSSLTNTYSLEDKNPYSGVSYYRLTQFDFNGESEIFTPVAVNLRSANTNVSIYPNPAKDFTYANISTQEIKDKVEISILDISGRIIYTYQNQITEGDNLIQIDTSNLPSGHYFISLQSEKGINLNQPLILN